MTFYEEIWEFIENVAKEEQLALTLKETSKLAACAATGAAAAALILGPVGGIIGAAGGGIIGYATGNDFKPLHEVISGMSRDSKERLAKNVEKIMSARNITAVATLVTLASQGSELRRVVIEEVRNHAN